MSIVIDKIRKARIFSSYATPPLSPLYLSVPSSPLLPFPISVILPPSSHCCLKTHTHHVRLRKYMKPKLPIQSCDQQLLGIGGSPCGICSFYEPLCGVGFSMMLSAESPYSCKKPQQIPWMFEPDIGRIISFVHPHCLICEEWIFISICSGKVTQQGLTVQERAKALPDSNSIVQPCVQSIPNSLL